MYKSTSNAQHYLRREGSHSTKPSPRGVNLLGWGVDETLSPEDQRRAMCARITQINHLLRDNKKSMPKWEAEALAGEMMRLEQRVRDIRPKRRLHGVQEHFMDVARERLTKAEFTIWMNEAASRLEKDAAKNKGKTDGSSV